jgi:hypothetical protein
VRDALRGVEGLLGDLLRLGETALVVRIQRAERRDVDARRLDELLVGRAAAVLP